MEEIIEKIINEFSLKCTVKEFLNNKDGVQYSSVIDWDDISHVDDLPVSFLNRFQDRLKWYYVSQHTKIPVNLLENYRDDVDWDHISKTYKLTESFLEKFENDVDWNIIIVEHKLSGKLIEKFYRNMDWDELAEYQVLSYKFIEKFSDEMDLRYLSQFQKLSEKFIARFKENISWYDVCRNQRLSEKFIARFKEYVDWDRVSAYQPLSEDFIEKAKEYVNWDKICECQPLSKRFIKKFGNSRHVNMHQKSHAKKSYTQKLKEVKAYAKKHKLQMDSKFLYAFRNHDKQGRGAFNDTISYKKGIYYRDWHCDMNKSNYNSFGLGIFPDGNTSVKVKIKDWGIAVDSNRGKARVWGFEIVEHLKK